MSTGDLMDDDPDVGAAVQKILARGASALGDEVREDARENREDREAHELAEDADMDARPDPVEPEGEEGAEQAAAEGDEQFLEIPGDTEGADPIKVPLAEAAEAVKQIRQMNGDIATAVTKAEIEAYEKQDRITSSMLGVYQKIEQEARAAVELMYQFMPQPPDRSLLETDPQAFYAQRVWYDDYVTHANKVRATIAQAQQGQTIATTEAEKLEVERENARLARYVPEWAKPETREAKRGEILSALQAKYGITKEDLEGVTSHKAWRIMADLVRLNAVDAKAPEVRKAVQEKAVKLRNGKMPAREEGTGRFVGDARKELRESGSVDAAARLFMRSGLTKGL